MSLTRRTVGTLAALAALAALAVAAPTAAGRDLDDPAPASALQAPVPGPVTRPFEPPPHPYGPGHRGVDLAAGPGDAVRAPVAGEVLFAGRVAGQTWVTLRHGSRLVTTYGDLAALAVTPGQRVGAGDRLGVVPATADHVHWGARLDGAYIDPLTLLVRWLPALAGATTARMAR